jgi:hypothetical protein
MLFLLRPKRVMIILNEKIHSFPGWRWRKLSLSSDKGTHDRIKNRSGSGIIINGSQMDQKPALFVHRQTLPNSEEKGFCEKNGAFIHEWKIFTGRLVHACARASTLLPAPRKSNNEFAIAVVAMKSGKKSD